MTNEVDRYSLQEICHAINSNGFFAVFHDDTDINPADTSTSISWMRKAIQYEYGNILDVDSSTAIVDPNNKPVVICKINAGLFNAIPIFHGAGLDKFYAFSTSANLDWNGIIIVSHKLKILAIFQACIDVSSPKNTYVALWLMQSTYASQWLEWKHDLHKYDYNALLSKLPSLSLKAMYAKYNRCLFPFRSTFFNPNVEVCLSIDDYYHSALLHEKMCISNEVSQLKSSIKSAEHIIEGQQQKIVDFNAKISQLEKSLHDFETGLYASRIDVDLGTYS